MILASYITTSLRSITKHKFYSVLNIVGLSLGLTLVLFIGLFLNKQFSFDRWYKDHDRIYRVEFGDWGILGPVYARIIQSSSAEIEQTLRINNNWGHNVTVRVSPGDPVLKIPHLVLADPVLFEFFPFSFISGSSAQALADKNSIVLTRSQALRLYGHTDITGQILRVSDQYNLLITGVIEDVKHFHLGIDAIGSFALFGDIFSPEYFESTGDWNHHTYVKLHPQSDAENVSRNISTAIHTYITELFGVEFDHKVNLRPVSDIYFTNSVPYEIMVIHGSKITSWAFMAIALFILIIAIINFVNLSTARSAGRARETGIRKLLGSNRAHLILQFLSESVLLSLISIIIAFGLAEVLLPWFNYATNTDNSLQNLGIGTILGIMVSGSLLIGLLSGVYPAFYLSAFQPINSLKGEFDKGRGAAFFRKSLIVFQFTISVALIAGTLIVYEQLQFMKVSNPGFNKENIIHFNTNTQVRRSWESFRNTLLSDPSVQQVALSNTVPGFVRWQETLILDGEGFQFTFWPMTPEYFHMLELELLAGRVFTREQATDQEQGVIVNESWVKSSGIPYDSYEDLIDYNLNYRYAEQGYKIIGIAADFHFNSLHQAIGPLMFVWRERSCHTASIQINDLRLGIAHLKRTWAEVSPEEAIEYHFLSDTIAGLYEGENRLAFIFMSFSAFAVIIACLGLFGLASFMVEKRTHEIAIRKVMGATTQNLMMLFTREFLLLVIIAIMLATPLGWLGMQYWLDGFSYRIEMDLVPFIIAGLIAIILMLITVGYHVVKVSQQNPSEALNKE